MPRGLSFEAAFLVMSSLLAGSNDARLGLAHERESQVTWKIVECADFNFDDLADVLWYSPTRNVITVWRMAGTRVLAPGPEIEGPTGQSWAAVPINEEAADFNRDGMADVLWHDPATNRVMMWLMRGTGVPQKGHEIQGPPDGEGWDLGTIGDFTGDGTSGILWHNARTRSQIVWDLAGTVVSVRGGIIAAPEGPGWKPILGVDYNGDFLSDVLWFNASRNVIAVWLMAGTEVLEKGAEIAGPEGGGWVPVASPDMNLDDLADMVWFNTGRNVMSVWLMAGTRVLSRGPEIGGPAGGGFVIPTLADFNGDLMADVVWEDPSTNRFAVWLMNGTQVLSAGPTLRGPGAAGG